MSEEINSKLAKLKQSPAFSKERGYSAQRNELVPGQVVSTRYQVLCLIGRGAMGSVYRVEQVALRKHLALKTLNAVAVSDANVRRFQNEALAASKLDHPNLVRALDYGWLDTQPFLVMDLIEGQTLAEHLKQVARLPLDFALQVFIPICFALAYAHEQGVVHRDLKPSNIVLSPQDNYGAQQVVPKIVDFGIAKLDYGQEGSLTKTGEVFGTPLYMSPEQCLGSKVDGRSDIYALGCVLYEALTGAPPFAGAGALETMMQHHSEKPRPLKEASLGTEFPAALEEIVFKMLAKNPQDRYQSCAEAAKDLISLQKGENVRVKQTKSESPLDKVLIKHSAIAMLFLLSAIAIFVFSQSQEKAQKSSSSNIAPPHFDAGHPDHFAPVAGAEGTLNPFSKIVGDERVFDFGSLQVGEFVRPTGHLKATGRVAFPKTEKLFLEMSFMTACHNPQLLLRFKGDDLIGLRLFYNSDYEIYLNEIPNTIFDETLSLVSHFKQLQILSLNYAPVSMRGLKNLHVEDLSNLRELDIAHTDIDGKELAKLPFLQRLAFLDMGQGHDLQAVLKSLQGSKRIQSLNLAYGDLTDADVSILATMPNLQELHLSGNRITDHGLADLKNLTKLTHLELLNCPVTMAGIGSLTKLPNLKTLSLPTGLRANRVAIEDALPHCKIAFEPLRFNDLIRNHPDPYDRGL